MSKYQLWVHYTTQEASHPRGANEYSLVMETDKDWTGLFLKRMQAEQDGNNTLVTKEIELKAVVVEKFES